MLKPHSEVLHPPSPCQPRPNSKHICAKTTPMTHLTFGYRHQCGSFGAYAGAPSLKHGKGWTREGKPRNGATRKPEGARATREKWERHREGTQPIGCMTETRSEREKKETNFGENCQKGEKQSTSLKNNISNDESKPCDRAHVKRLRTTRP